MKNIRIGVAQLTPGWQIILSQIGVNFRQLSKNSSVDPDEYSLLIINSAEFNLDLLQKWFNVGGAILWEAKAYCFLNKISYHTKNVKYVLPKSKFQNLGILDFHCEFTYPIDDSLQFENKNLGISHKGLNTFIPFHLDDVILDDCVMRKRFYFNRNELPSELVSKVSKGRIRILIQLLIEELHHKQKLPFVHKWFFPRDAKSIFVFRVDTDFCKSDDAKKLHNVCTKHEINGSWFLDTESEDRISDIYSTFTTQELGLHCDQHLVFDNYKMNIANLKSGLNKLHAHEIIPQGFAAPFGQWNSSLGKALEDLDFKYSSEFNLNYDDIPFFSFIDDHISNVLQIPIHPISPGRLRRSHFTFEEMKKYFREITKRNIKLKLPVIFYHHPHHQLFDVLDDYFAFINEKKILNLSMFNYAKWWGKRNALQTTITFKEDTINADITDSEIFYRISTQDGEKIISLHDSVDLNSNMQQSEQMINAETNRMRKWNWRDKLYNYENKRSKKILKSSYKTI